MHAPAIGLSARSALVALLVAGLSAPMGGCATMVHGRTQIVDVNSTPPGARVHLSPTGEVLATPCKVVLRRKDSYVLRVEKDGYQVESVALESKASSSLWRNVVWIHPVGWIIGVSVDLGTGSGYEFDPEAVDVTLTPLGTPAAAK